MSGTDKYLDGWLNVVAHANLRFKEEQGSFSDHAAAYLREHFVTREFHTESKNSLHKLVRDLCDQLMTLTADRDRLRAALKPFAERETVAETLGKETPLPWSGKSPVERLAMMKEAKERHDGEILAARQAQSEIKETKRLTYSAGFATVNGVKISSAEIDQLVKLRDQAEREEKHRGYPIP